MCEKQSKVLAWLVIFHQCLLEKQTWEVSSRKESLPNNVPYSLDLKCDAAVAELKWFKIPFGEERLFSGGL